MSGKSEVINIQVTIGNQTIHYKVPRHVDGARGWML